MNADHLIYEFAGRRLDPARRQLTHGGKPVAHVSALLRRAAAADRAPRRAARQGLPAAGALARRGGRREQPREGDLRRPPRARRGRRGIRAASSPFPVAATVSSPTLESRGAVGTPSTPHAGSRERRIRSLAVLPLHFLNPAAGDETLSLGLADALITRLGQLRRTLVRPTSSIARFAARAAGARAAGRELGGGRRDHRKHPPRRRAAARRACSWSRWRAMP